MATVQVHSNKTAGTLYLAFELGWDGWKLAFSTALGDNSRQKKVNARRMDLVMVEIKKAKLKFKL